MLQFGQYDANINLWPVNRIDNLLACNFRKFSNPVGEQFLQMNA